MKIKNLFILLLLLISFTSCVEKITRVVHQDTIPPNYSVEKEVLKSRISDIIPAEEVSFSSTKTTKSGEEEFNALNLEIVPDSFPSSGLAFYQMTDELQRVVESGIQNMEDYQQLTILVKQTTEKDGVKHNRSYRKEIDL